MRLSARRLGLIALTGASTLGLIGGGLFWASFSTEKPRVELDGARLAKLESFDYSDWSSLLAAHVDHHGRVNYEAMSLDRTALDRHVALVARVGPTTRPELFPDRSHELAYYINTYNALTMFSVLNRLPELTSVRDSAADFFYFTEFQVDGTELSLYRLEDNLRKRFKEPRIHFTLNCASAGCPRLPSEPFLPATLEVQLARETHNFLREKRNVAVESGDIVLSEIFDWYADDFTPDPTTWIRAQAPDLSLPREATVRFRPYDWSLNAQTRGE